MRPARNYYTGVYIQMNNYPKWWNTTVTIYNRYEDRQTQVITWFRHTVDGCFWKYTGNTVNVGETILETKDIICRIPEQSDFLEKYLWEQLPNDEMSSYFTLGSDDLIIKGAVTDEIDEYVKGKRSTDLLEKYKRLQGCMEVEQVALNVGGGRNEPHYYVKGT